MSGEGTEESPRLNRWVANHALPLISNTAYLVFSLNQTRTDSIKCMSRVTVMAVFYDYRLLLELAFQVCAVCLEAKLPLQQHRSNLFIDVFSAYSDDITS